MLKRNRIDSAETDLDVFCKSFREANYGYLYKRGKKK